MKNFLTFCRVKIQILYSYHKDYAQNHHVILNSSKLLENYSLQDKIVPFISEIKNTTLDYRTTQKFNSGIYISYWFYD